jgi:hypothetical protein
MYDKISQCGHLTPRDMRMFLVRLWGNMPRCFADNLDAPEYGILALEIRFKFVPGFIRNLIERDSGRFQNIHQIGVITRHQSPAPNQGYVFA